MDNPLLLQTRRHFFKGCSIGLGSMALGSLLGNDNLFGTQPSQPDPGVRSDGVGRTPTGAVVEPLD